MSEAELKRQVVAIAQKNGWLVHETAQVKPLRPVKGRNGYPDLTLARGGEVLWFELKTQAGKASPDQVYWGSMLGFDSWFVVRPADLEWVRDYLR